MPTVLLAGTADTKSDEIAYLQSRVRALGAQPLTMDVGVLAAGHAPVDIANTEVAAAAGTTLQAVIDSGDENTAMTLMAEGAAALASRLHAEGRIHGFLALGGSMGTDLAFDVAAALPLGVPKVVISTIAYSHLIPPERITPDLIMVLWAGGLYGLNSLCQSALAQGAGAVVGAMQAAQPPRLDRPLVGMTSLGKSCLAYMVRLMTPPKSSTRACAGADAWGLSEGDMLGSRFPGGVAKVRLRAGPWAPRRRPPSGRTAPARRWRRLRR
jgi:uncharacterized protein (UPF0261 family)